MLFDIGKVLPGFPFVVILAAKRKVEADPESVVALLRGMKRGLDFLKSNKEKVAAAVIKKGIFGDPTTIRKTVYQFSEVYSLPITKEDIDAVIVAARIEAEAKSSAAQRNFSALLHWQKPLGRADKNAPGVRFQVSG